MLLAVLLAAAAAPAGVHSSAVVVTADGATVLAVNPDSCSLSAVDAAAGKLLAEIPVGRDPRTVAVTADGRLAVTANRGERTVSLVDLERRRERGYVVVGALPWGIVVGPGAREAWVACEGSSQVMRLDLASRTVTASIPVEPDPTGLALTSDGTLLVTHLRSGEVSFIDTATARVEAVVPVYSSSNLMQSVVLSPDGSRAYLPHTRSNASNTDLTFDTTVFPIVAVLDVPSRTVLRPELLSLAEVDRPVALPHDAALTPDGETLLVVNLASQDLSVVDLAARRTVAHLALGHGPRGVAVSPDGTTAWVNNTLDGTLSVIDAASWTVTGTVELTDLPLPPALLHGKRLFYSSADTRLARDRWIACASCHWEGEQDGRTWRFAFSGPRNTTSLLGMIGTYPLRWSARWDESADSEAAIRLEQFGTGLIEGEMNDTLGAPNQGRSYDLDCLAAYIDSLQPAPVPPPATDPSEVAAGRALFFSERTGCSTCHPPPRYTDFATHDVGTAGGSAEHLGPEMDTPSLIGLARSAPYLHDGSAPTLRAVLIDANPEDRHGTTSGLDEEEIDALVSFLESLPSGEVPPLRQTPWGPELPPPAPRPNSFRVLGSGPELSGTVVDGTGEGVAGALVTTRNGSTRTATDGEGRFRLRLAGEAGGEVELTAWAAGYFITEQDVTPPASGITLELTPLHGEDHPETDWIDPRPDQGDEGACGTCHPEILSQWQANAHGRAISNARFFSFYRGTTLDGSTTVRPGYLLDFPGTAGSCAACHAPGAAADAPFTTDMDRLEGVVTAGIHCQVCHDTERAYLHPVDHTPYPNMPGILSMRLLRPPQDGSVFFGPYPDIHRPDTYAPQMRESGFCAPCHQFSFWGTPIYTSYGEWAASSYARRGITCQDCHMPPTGATHYALPEVGGREHPAGTIPSHLQLGIGSASLMASAATLDVETAREAGEIRVTVTVTNTGAGHDLPTDHPGRNLILLVEADADGGRLEAADGPRVPDWGGSLAGRSGFGLARVLEDAATGESPVVSYWKPSLEAGDTRLPAGASRTGSWTFPDPGGEVTVRARLIFRRLFEEIANRYGWPLDETVMEEVTTHVDDD